MNGKNNSNNKFSQEFQVPRVPPISMSMLFSRDHFHQDSVQSEVRIPSVDSSSTASNGDTILNDDDVADSWNSCENDIEKSNVTTTTTANIIRINEIKKMKQKNDPETKTEGNKKKTGDSATGLVAENNKICPSCAKIFLEDFIRPMENYMKNLWMKVAVTDAETLKQFTEYCVTEKCHDTIIDNDHLLMDRKKREQENKQDSNCNHSDNKNLSSSSSSSSWFNGQNMEKKQENITPKGFDFLSRRLSTEYQQETVTGRCTDDYNIENGKNLISGENEKKINDVKGVKEQKVNDDYSLKMEQDTPKPKGISVSSSIHPHNHQLPMPSGQRSIMKSEQPKKIKHYSLPRRKSDPGGKRMINKLIEEEINDDKNEKEIPFAYSTIIQNNLDALNGLIMANSLHYYDNHQLTVFEKNTEKIKFRYRIPLVALVDYQVVDVELIHLIEQLYDHVERLNSSITDLALLNDESLGIKHVKIQLWKFLAESGFKKSVYLDPTVLVVGKISNLFLEYQELSASNDCFYPDYFDCSVMVLEPKLTTYKDLINFGVQLTMKNEFSGSVDGTTLLNEYFSTKWQRLSFLYNYRRNDSSYTQMAAFFRFGENVRIVNFAAAVRSSGNQEKSRLYQQNDIVGYIEPWNYKFELNGAKWNSEEEDEINQTSFPMFANDNYSKFYLILFVRRIWPLLSPRLTPLLASLGQQSQWSISELAQIIGHQTKDQNVSLPPLRPWKSPFERPSSSSILDRTVPEFEIHQKNHDKATVESESDKLLDDAKNLHDWECGRIDWMHQHRSDKIIDRLKTKF